MSKLAGRVGRSLLPGECLGTHRFMVEGSSSTHTEAATPLAVPVVQEPGRSRGALGPHGPPPLTLLFGWAGASKKNLAKYTNVYLDQGCTTAHLTLPSRNVFKDTEEIPEVMESLVKQLEKVGVRERPLVVHCLSDTGAMCYQGLQIATNGNLDIRGVVWDSCPGPRPEITPARIAALLTVNWFCARQDGYTRAGAFNNSYRLLVERGWPQYLRRLKGQSLDLSLMDGVWAGHFGRDHSQSHPEIAELFLYSNSDFYLPHKYLEAEVLDKRRKEGAKFSATRFEGSRHVQHFRKHPAQYEAAVSGFLRRTWGTVEREEELQGDNRTEQGLRFPQLQSRLGM